MRDQSQPKNRSFVSFFLFLALLYSGNVLSTPTLPSSGSFRTQEFQVDGHWVLVDWHYEPLGNGDYLLRQVSGNRNSREPNDFDPGNEYSEEAMRKMLAESYEIPCSGAFQAFQ